ncbi:MAG: amino acid adenylation domain-containing protein [Chlorobiaceae bacterium]|nr:amino acid adenylation domain-containing protein [Chlorobiaceae bacterium]
MTTTYGNPLYYPLSSVQRELWFDQALFPDTPIYNVGGYSFLKGELDLCLFRKAITMVAEENDALRMVLTERDGTPFQSFPDMGEAALTIVDVSDGNDPEKRALTHIRKEHNRAFRILGEPFFRHTIYKLADKSFIWQYLFYHLAVDGHAMSLVLHRIAAHYNALLQGHALPLRQEYAYREFLLYDALPPEPERLEGHRQYWREKFTPLPEPLFSPASREGSTGEVIPGSVHTGYLPRRQYERAEAFARMHSVSLFHFLIGILYLYFTRVEDQDECVMGVPMANRNTPLFRETIGHFVAVIPERFSYGRDISFTELIKAVSGTLRRSYRHQGLPLSEIVRQSGAMQRGRKRLYDLAFSWEKQNYSFRFGPACATESASLVHDFEQIPLAIFVLDFSENRDVLMQFAYNHAYFDAPEIELLEARLLHLIDEVLANPDMKISALDILPQDEREQLLVGWNATDAPLPEKFLHQMFEAHAAEHPDSTALCFQNSRIGYAELNAGSNQLAHALIALGIQRDAPVAIALERTPEMIVAMMAVLKAGGCYLPLDPSWPPERLAFMLEDSGTELLLTSELLRGRLSLKAVQTLCPGAGNPFVSSQPSGNPDLAISPEQLAYIIYTSGSTGTPKGVAVSHRGVGNMVLAQISAFGVMAKSRVLLFASFSFDASVSEIATALCSGAELHLPDEEQRIPGLALRHYLEDSAITHITLPPTALALLPKAGLPLLESLVVAGEPCSPALAAFWSKGRRFFNGYGPTEATVCTTIAECRHEDISPDRPLPIGRPIANTRLYLLDRNRQPVPTGIAGELYIGGVGLASGYLNRPELTAEKFIPDPFSSRPGERLYKTGDLVRYRTDGNLEFLGRLDHQLKIRGFRIEAGEIESALTAIPSIRSALVDARNDPYGQPALAAWLVAAGSPPSIAGLRADLGRTLPDYMIPTSFLFLDAMPLTVNGKIDRKSLPDPEHSVSENSAAPPRDPVEELLVELWARALSQRSCSIHDNFFDLGGESLIAARLTVLLHDAGGISIPVRWIFEAPTPALLAGRIRESGTQREPSQPVPENPLLAGTKCITPDLLPLVDLSREEIDHLVTAVEGGAGNIQDIYPLTPLQEGIYFHSQLQRDGDTWQSCHLFSFDSLERAEAFTGAMQAVVDRHDMLRTAFVWGALHEPVQVVMRHAAVPFTLLHPDREEGPIADQLMHLFSPRSNRLNLAAAPLIRTAVAEDGDRWLMLFSAHHLIMDYTTMKVVFDEITAHLDGDAGRLSPPVPFRNFIPRLCGAHAPGISEPFFRDMLGDISIPTAPFGLLNVNGDGSAIAEAKKELQADLALRLRSVARLFSATPAAVCHLAWALLLSRICGQEAVVFGTVLAGRMQGGEGVERVVGLFINTLPIRLTCDARPVSEAVRQARHRLLALMRHESASLSMAQQCSSVPSPMPLFTSLLNYRHTRHREQGLFRHEGIEMIMHTEGATNYPFGLSIDDYDEGFSLTAQMDSSIDPDWICTLYLSALELLVRALEEAPDTPIAELELFSPEERGKIASMLPQKQRAQGLPRSRQSGTL